MSQPEREPRATWSIEYPDSEPDPDPLLSIRKSRLEAVLLECWQESYSWSDHPIRDRHFKRNEYIARALTELEQA